MSLAGRLVLEHHTGSEFWQGPEPQQFCNEMCLLSTDMCCFGLHLPANKENPKGLTRKSTRLQASHQDMKPFSQRPCLGESKVARAQHAPIAGSDALGKMRTHADRYTPEFVQAILDSVPALYSEDCALMNSLNARLSPKCWQ